MHKFSDVKMIEMYINRPEDYYESQLSSPGFRGFWFRKRQSIAYELLKKYWGGGIVLDIGCGNCLWHKDDIPTVGVDINLGMLRYNKLKLGLFSPLCADISSGLPLKDGSVDTIMIMEVLEHFKEHGRIVDELSRILKPGGNIIVSVPYGRLPGLWGLLFPLWCKYRGLIFKDNYYLNNCGHVFSFSISNLIDVFRKFKYLEHKNFNGLTIFLAVKKAK